MDKKALVNMDIDQGRKILELLDQTSKLEISCAFWFYSSDINGWKLIIATSIIDTEGPIKSYEKVQKVINKHKDQITIPLETIAIVSPKDQLIQIMKMAINTGPGISGIRFTGNVINGVLIEDAYIYRVN